MFFAFADDRIAALLAEKRAPLRSDLRRIPNPLRWRELDHREEGVVDQPRLIFGSRDRVDLSTRLDRRVIERQQFHDRRGEQQLAPLSARCDVRTTKTPAALLTPPAALPFELWRQLAAPICVDVANQSA